MKPVQVTRDEHRMTTTYLREPVRVLLEARPSGLGEAMLMHLLRTDDMDCLGKCAAAYAVTDDKWVSKVRKTCRQVGARRDADGVWSLPDSRIRNAA